jgi:hypothetical protein
MVCFFHDFINCMELKWIHERYGFEVVTGIRKKDDLFERFVGGGMILMTVDWKCV